MRASFLVVVVGTVLSFATGTSIGRLALDSVGVAIVVLGCVGVLASLFTAALVVERAAPAESVAAD